MIKTYNIYYMQKEITLGISIKLIFFNYMSRKHSIRERISKKLLGFPMFYEKSILNFIYMQ